MISKYLSRVYRRPPCWALVADIYQQELGFDLSDYTPSTEHPIAVADAFRLALHGGKHGFTKESSPSNYDVVLLGRKRPTHCGIWYDGGVLHALDNAITHQPIAQIRDAYQFVEFWRYGHN